MALQHSLSVRAAGLQQPGHEGRALPRLGGLGTPGWSVAQRKACVLPDGIHLWISVATSPFAGQTLCSAHLRGDAVTQRWMRSSNCSQVRGVLLPPPPCPLPIHLCHDLPRLPLQCLSWRWWVLARWWSPLRCAWLSPGEGCAEGWEHLPHPSHGGPWDGDCLTEPSRQRHS